MQFPAKMFISLTKACKIKKQPKSFLTLFCGTYGHQEPKY